MNRFSRIRHHVSVEDVKKKHLEKIAVENFIKEEEVIVKEISNRFRRDWKREIFEGMTTANIMTAPLAPAGDEVFNDTPTTSADVFDVAPARDPGFSYDAMVGTSIKSSGSGTGNNGGFDIGNHVAFDGSGSGGARWCVLKAIDTTEVDTMVVRAITGNGSNGGQTPDETLEDLILYYKTPEMFDYIPITYFPELTGSAFQGGNDIIIPVGHGLSGLQDYQIKIPSYARGKETRFLLYQVASTASGQDTYGLTNISFRRQTPVNVVVPLDSPEAISFINVGTNEGDPKKRKKKVDDMLSASDEYTTKQMGDQFPGQGGRIDGEDPFKSAPLTPDDVIERSPIGKGEVTKSFANFSTTAAAAQPEAETEAEPAEDPQVITTRQSTIATDPEGNEIDPEPVEAGAVQGADATNLDQDEPTDPEPTDPEPTDPDQEETEQELETEPDVEDKSEEQLDQQLEDKTNALEKALTFGVESNLLGFKKLAKVAKFAVQGILSVMTIADRLNPFKKQNTETNALQGGLSMLLNSLDIAMSVMDGKITKSNPTAAQINTYKNSILPDLFKSDSSSYIPISDVRHEYADDNIYVERIDGKAVVRDNTSGIKQNLTFKGPGVGGNYKGFQQVGGGYSQFIIPKDGGEPYVHYYDYNYDNINNPSDVAFGGGIIQSGKVFDAGAFSKSLSNLIHQLRPSNTKLPIPARAKTSMIGYFTNFQDVISALQTTSTLEGWPPGIHGAALTDITIPLSELPEETQEMIANHPLSWTPERIANMSEEDYFDEIGKRSERFEDDDYILKAMEDPDSGVDPEFLENYKRFDFYTQYDENTGTHPDAKEGTVQYDYDRAVEELEKISDSPEYSAASDAAIKEYENVNKERDEKYAENEEKFGSKARSDLYEKLVGPYYRAVQRATRGGGSISKNSPTYQKMIDGKKKYDKQVKVLERKYAQGRNAIRDEYDKLSDEAYARYNDTVQVIKLDDGTFGMVNGGDFKTKGGKVIPGKRTLTAKQQARFDEVRKEYEDVQNYLYSDAANYMDNMYKPFVLYDVRTQFAKYGVSSDSWTPKNPKGSESKSDPTPDPSFTGSAASFVGGDATAAATAAAETKKNKKKNESLEYFANPYGSVTLFEKLKTKGFFNPKDIKPTFPENDPPELDPKTKMHPNYGKQAGRYKRLDPISANAMPPTGDSEIDAVVDKQRTKPRPKTQTTFSRLKKFRKKG